MAAKISGLYLDVWKIAPYNDAHFSMRDSRFNADLIPLLVEGARKCGREKGEGDPRKEYLFEYLLQLQPKEVDRTRKLTDV